MTDEKVWPPGEFVRLHFDSGRGCRGEKIAVHGEVEGTFRDDDFDLRVGEGGDVVDGIEGVPSRGIFAEDALGNVVALVGRQAFDLGEIEPVR